MMRAGVVTMRKRRLLLLALLAQGLGGQARAQQPDMLAGLPDYQPQQQVTGVIRCWGSQHMGKLLKRWEGAFRQLHPGVVFVDTLKGTASAQFGLHVNVADLALSGRELYPYEYYGIYRRSQLYPVEIEVATGSLNVRGKSTALGVFVHKDNPLAQLSLKQLDGIYGDQRSGGWQKIEWVEAVARGTADNIRTWGQLGLSGAWADKPIHVYGPPGVYPGGVTYFQTRVMGGADTWNEGRREYADRALMLKALAADKYGIAYAAVAYATPQVKPLALAEQPGGPFVLPTYASVAQRAYPLSRSAYIYLAPDTASGDRARIEPKLREFLRFILSRQGQQEVVLEGDYLPLQADKVAEQLKKLN
jgi:phosphate transport system substrate-binding protein